ncbi:Domain of Kin17 curved DNA-binding protein [Carpediemonas membranifera]|uniref:Domain of Kin17 curved DNA-binding protein n=1 Tax=Carpediemonas membranifera TaxID=201153 RepID=A0A8J6B6H7_9EUKA|nr:Domain of Kin17 curved DNA-binding protein [Carpediemonas membranifera]|eukprot:KAG9395284.1 Domain of Kin17 curved DNA-binding protein [Carpediemonas membranifera]
MSGAIHKAKKPQGRKKTRFYCELCKKQCSDANGFKCHTETEHHKQMLRVFSENQDAYLRKLSGKFHGGMMRIISTRYARTAVLMNTVYNEYIGDPHHVHMNATRWTSLSGYTQWLASIGMVWAEERPEGWYVRYIDKDPTATKLRLEGEEREKARARAEREARAEMEEQRLVEAVEDIPEAVVEAAVEAPKTIKKVLKRGKKEKREALF